MTIAASVKRLPVCNPTVGNRGSALFRYPGFAEALLVVVERRRIGVEMAVANHGNGKIRQLVGTLAEDPPSLFLRSQEAEAGQEGGVTRAGESMLLK
jgi:hypothetical protein